MPRVFDRVSPGLLDRTAANSLNRALEMLEQLLSPRGGDDVNVTSRPGGLLIRNPNDPPNTWIVIQGAPVSPGTFESFAEADVDLATGNWAVASDGFSGSSTLQALVPDGWPDPPAGTVCPVAFAADDETLIILTPGGGGTGPPPTFTWVESSVTWSANQNDFPLSSVTAGTTHLNVNATANVTLTGITSPGTPYLLWIRNVGTSTLSITNADTASASGNRFRLARAVPLILHQDDAWAFLWSVSLNCWESLGGAFEPDASASNEGIVNLVNQTFGHGTKTMDAVIANWVATTAVGQVSSTTPPAGLASIQFTLGSGSSHNVTILQAGSPQFYNYMCLGGDGPGGIVAGAGTILFGTYDATAGTWGPCSLAQISAPGLHQNGVTSDLRPSGGGWFIGGLCMQAPPAPSGFTGAIP